MRGGGGVPAYHPRTVPGYEESPEIRRTSSGIEVDPIYRGTDVPDRVGEPGEVPYTRGIHPGMYRSRLWTMRQYAGFGTAAETNRRFLDLLEAGQTGLSVAFEPAHPDGARLRRPTRRREVGKVSVAIDSLDDMRRLFQGIPLGEVSTSMTINSTAAILLLLYQLVAEEQRRARDTAARRQSSDILKEYVARGTYIYPPRPSMRLVTDLFAYASAGCRSGTRSRSADITSGKPAPRLPGGSPSPSPTAWRYVRAAIGSGLDVDDFAPGSRSSGAPQRPVRGGRQVSGQPVGSGPG